MIDTEYVDLVLNKVAEAHGYGRADKAILTSFKYGYLLSMVAHNEESAAELTELAEKYRIQKDY